KRPECLREQLEAIKKQTIKSDKIIIVHNEGDVDFEYPENVQLIYANPNMKFHLRFAIGLLVNTEYVSFLDDDTIPQERWHENCINTIEKHDCLCVTNGRLFVPPNRWVAPGWGNPTENEVLVDFGGHAWFMRRENLKFMWNDKIHEFKNGEDIMLSANLQIHGNIPTYVPPHPKNNLSLWGSHPEKAMKFGSDKVAQWIVEPAHYQERYKLIEQYVDLGWKLVNIK
ncbi:hypothetical protein LCGC14_2774190, partial [marine sediment metagenome]